MTMEIDFNDDPFGVDRLEQENKRLTAELAELREAAREYLHHNTHLTETSEDEDSLPDFGPLMASQSRLRALVEDKCDG